MILQIVEYPDKKLKEKSTPVEVFDAKLHLFLDSMYETMLDANGIGLAAIQVAFPKQILILNIPDEEDVQTKETLIEMINPQIIKKEGTTSYQEGCLSVPAFYEEVERFETITVQFQDRDGNKKELFADGLMSIAIQHEMDHLLGILFIDKLTYARRKKFEKEYKKLQKEKKRN